MLYKGSLHIEIEVLIVSQSTQGIRVLLSEDYLLPLGVSEAEMLI